MVTWSQDESILRGLQGNTLHWATKRGCTCPGSGCATDATGRTNQSESSITGESAHATSGMTQGAADGPILWCSEHWTHESCIANRVDTKAFWLTVFI